MPSFGISMSGNMFVLMRQHGSADLNESFASKGHIIITQPS